MAPTGDNISAGPYSSTAAPVKWSLYRYPGCFEFGSGSGKTERGALLGPGQRQTRVHKELVCGQITRLAPVEDGLGDVGGEIAEADDAGEIGPADTFALGKCGKRNTAAADAGSVELARPEEQLDQPGVGSGCGEGIGPVDQHPDLRSGAAQPDCDRQDLRVVVGHALCLGLLDPAAVDCHRGGIRGC